MKKLAIVILTVVFATGLLATSAWCDCPMMKQTQSQTQAHGCCAGKSHTCPAKQVKNDDSNLQVQNVQNSEVKPIKTACPYHSKSDSSDSDKDKSAQFSDHSNLKLSKQHTYLKDSALLI